MASGRELSVEELPDLACLTVRRQAHRTLKFLEKQATEVEQKFSTYGLARAERNFTGMVSQNLGLALTLAGIQVLR